MAGIWSCSNSKADSDIMVVNIDEALNKVEDVKLSDYAADINYIMLETADSALLGNITKIAFNNENIYIGSTDQMKTVHVFSKDGKFIKNVGIRGRAKGEYTAIRSIIPVPDMNAIMVEGGNKAVIYSLEDGKALRDIPFDEFLTGQQLTSRQINGRIITNASQHVQNIFYNGKGSFTILTFNKNDGQQNLLMLDSDLNVKESVSLRQGVKYAADAYTQRGGVIKMPPMFVSGSCYMLDGQLNFFHGYKDTLYAIKGNSYIPKMAINYGYYGPKEPNKITAEEMWAMVNNESENLIFLNAKMPLSNQQEADAIGTAHLIYDKIGNRTRLLKFTEDIGGAVMPGGGAFMNDIDNGLPFWPTEVSGSKMYMTCDAGKFIELAEKYNSPKMKEVAAKLTDESNPILVEVTLK